MLKLKANPMNLQEEFYGRPIIVADREFVEQKSEGLIESARTEDVAFLGICNFSA